MINVKFLESISFEGRDYGKGERHDLPETKVKAFGDSVGVVVKTTSKSSEASADTTIQANEQVTSAKVDKLAKKAERTRQPLPDINLLRTRSFSSGFLAANGCS